VLFILGVLECRGLPELFLEWLMNIVSDYGPGERR
jgi:hypothetical protein